MLLKKRPRIHIVRPIGWPDFGRNPVKLGRSPARHQARPSRLRNSSVEFGPDLAPDLLRGSTPIRASSPRSPSQPRAYSIRQGIASPAPWHAFYHLLRASCRASAMPLSIATGSRQSATHAPLARYGDCGGPHNRPLSGLPFDRFQRLHGRGRAHRQTSLCGDAAFFDGDWHCGRLGRPRPLPDTQLQIDARVRAALGDFGRHSRKFGRCRPDLARFRQNIGLPSKSLQGLRPGTLIEQRRERIPSACVGASSACCAACVLHWAPAGASFAPSLLEVDGILINMIVINIIMINTIATRTST